MKIESDKYVVISSFLDNSDMNKAKKVAYVVDDGVNYGIITSDGLEVHTAWYDDHKLSYLESIAENYVLEAA